MVDLSLYEVDIDTPQPGGRFGESPRAAFTKYNGLLSDVLEEALGRIDFDGASPPGDPVPHMRWIDTSVTPPRLRRRNSANTAWLDEGVAGVPRLPIFPSNEIPSVDIGPILVSGVVWRYSAYFGQYIRPAATVRATPLSNVVLSANTWTTIDFDATVGPPMEWDAANKRLYIRETCVFSVTLQININISTAAGNNIGVLCRVLIDGNSAIEGAEILVAGSTDARPQTTFTHTLAAGQYVSFQAYSSQSTTLRASNTRIHGFAMRY